MRRLPWTVCLAVGCILLLDCHCRHRHGCGDAPLLKSWGCSYVYLQRGFDVTGIDKGIVFEALQESVWRGSFDLEQSVRQTLSLSSANTRKFSLARILLLLGTTHWQFDGGSHGESGAVREVEQHARC
jgi:hypothetical protein